MKAIMVMFDTLNRRFLPPYGAQEIHAPNFTRLAERTATFDTCYAGSMPCMPARRELHTGRHNFLHRSWGPLEPFDDSMPQILGEHDVHTHLVTDHQHYWEDGGATYHGRYRTFEFFRGQEGDPWKGHVADPDIPDAVRVRRGEGWRQDWINRQYLADEADHPQTRTFDAGLEFLYTNHAEDDWFLQIETFDPHEPFFSYARHKQHYAHAYDGPHFDWPDYKQVSESDEQVDHARREYAALLSMCDASLGRVLDTMDELALWDDTLLIVCTDHGLLLGEHGWWGKNVQPWYDETIHTPLFIWDPRSRVQGERRTSLVQTIDLAPTLLDHFGLAPTPDMQGHPLQRTVTDDTPVREAGLFGAFGGHVSVTDGRHVYMRASAERTNQPLHEHTLMPTHMRGRFAPAELKGAELVPPFSFTKEVPLVKVPGHAMSNPYAFGTLLYDLETDPEQQNSLVDDALELRMATLLTDLLRTSDAPREQYVRLGLPESGPVTEAHLLARTQRPQVEASTEPPPRPEDFPPGPLSVHVPLRDLLAHTEGERILRAHFAALLDGPFARMAAELSLLQIATFAVGLVPRDLLRAIATELAAASSPELGTFSTLTANAVQS
ncbi:MULTISPECIES: sulfatase-like hydrolase/transferase [unclassified Streptomyces]|uniref:sulfatase-like hydrolase/transferase n=1 Tax=unclassified Streptomyces TaxID=2593676 RepID=UPI002E376F80|nr:sulfatase-like hydrolase/transferase [Streptomyces sp. NBC_01280]WSE19100.1 sulfatase-like hydrolase/transferase [Streptomyces sp. NBC_01397]